MSDQSDADAELKAAMAANPYRGTDLWRLVKGVDLLDRLREHLDPEPGSLEWILPPEVLPGVTRAWGMPVRRAEGLPGPYLAHRVGDPDQVEWP